MTDPDRIGAETPATGSINDPATVLIGIGNSGRRDDGLGWAFLDAVERDGSFMGRIEYRYQLQVEDAAMIRDAGRVIFVDACHDSFDAGFSWGSCQPSDDFEYTTHVLPPQAVLHLCQDLYKDTPCADMLLIEGAEWGLEEGLSPAAKANLEKALRFFSNAGGA